MAIFFYRFVRARKVSVQSNVDRNTYRRLLFPSSTGGLQAYLAVSK